MKLSLKTNVKVKTDQRQWKRMVRNLTRSNNKAIQVGWWNTRHPSGVSVAQIVKWNEEGHINGGMFAGTYTPPRPAMRIGFMPLAKGEILPKYINRVHDIAMGRYTWTMLHTSLAKELQEGLQKTILSWSVPSNSPVTVALKGFNDPLIETGTTYDSVKYKLVSFKVGGLNAI